MTQYLTSESLSSLVTISKYYSFLAFQILALIILGHFFAKWLSKQGRSILERLSHSDKTLTLFVSAALHYMVMLFVGIACLSKMGIQTTSILTVLGTAGLAVGLALQSTLSNIAAGLVIIFLRPFRVGEYIEAGDTAGTVNIIGIFATELQTSDGLFVMTPNSQLWSKSIKNYTRNPNRRVVINVGISYKDDLENAKNIILQFLDSEEKTLKTPAPDVLVDLLADSSVNLIVRFWTLRTDYLVQKSEITKKIKVLFDKEGVTIPFPQREVLVVNENTPT